jgi:hypothetical protein
MKTFLTLILIGLVTAGCASAPTATPVPATTGAVSGAPARTPAGLMTGRDQSSQPLSVTANPPHVLLGPTLGAPAGWQTFTSLALGVAVDFPADWTEVEGEAGVQFSSPQGATISLAAAKAAGDNSAYQCTSLVLASGLTAETCGDIPANRYYASFAWSAADGASHTAVLSTQDTAALEVYKSMLASLRPAQ